MSRIARSTPLALALVLATALPLAAQTADVDVGGGEDVNAYVAPGLEARTPSATPLTAEDVPLFVPSEETVVGRISIPNDALGTLVQPAGREWRAFRIQGLFWIGAGLILVTLAALAGFFLWKGTIRIEAGRSGRWVLRFGSFERFTHWLTSLSFLILALTGIVLVFGRTLLIPLIGHQAFTTLAGASKSLHNWSGLPFAIGVVLMLVLWIRDNIPERADLVWLRQAGGILSGSGTPHPETGRFNAGQKGIFWAVVLGGLALTVTGYLLMVPFALTGIAGMQILHVVHALIAVVLIAIIIAHIYIGTLGMEGAFDAMGRGEVDENWAKEHHRGWYEAQARGTTKRAEPQPGRRGMPAE